MGKHKNKNNRSLIAKSIGFVTTFICFALCIGCSMIIGTLPEPDPIWKAAVGFGPHNKQGCLVEAGKQDDCRDRSARVASYLSQFYPAEPKALEQSLRDIGFECELIIDRQTSCYYKKSQAPSPCVGAYSVSIRVGFPANIPKVKSISQDLVVKGDPDNDDVRGCFPL